MIAAISGGPKPSTIAATGIMRMRVRKSLMKSEITDAANAISSALRGWPFFESSWPSMTVTTEAAVPGIEIRMAGTLPP